MSKKFLGQILKIENSVTSEVSQTCPICLEEYGSLSSDTGIIECGVRLPCNNHVVGSACIAIWLSANNSCPLCRHVFFPRQPRPNLEHGIMQDTGDDDDDTWDDEDVEGDEDDGGHREDEDDRADLYPWRYIIRWINQLSLEVVRLSERIVWHVETFHELATNSAVSIAAASLYIGSHLWRQPLSLGEISLVAGISWGAIQNVYRKIHADRFDLIDEDWPEWFGMPTMGQTAEALCSLPWPSLEHETLDGENDEDEESIEQNSDNLTRRNSFRHSRGGGLGLVKDLCNEFEIRNFTPSSHTPSSRVNAMACKIADKTYSMSLHGRSDNPWTVAAACTYMASHLMGYPRTLGDIEILSGVPASWIRNKYAVMNGLREQIIGEDWVREIVRDW